MAQHKFIGERLKRREDSRLLAGDAAYIADLRMPAMRFAAILRSPHAHARIISIDSSAARAVAGVDAIFVGDDLSDVATLPCAMPLPRKPFHAVLARGRVRHVGEPVAVVVAKTQEIARDALDLIQVEYNSLPAVLDAEKALAPDAPLLHPELATNLAHTTALASPAVDAAMR